LRQLRVARQEESAQVSDEGKDWAWMSGPREKSVDRRAKACKKIGWMNREIEAVHEGPIGFIRRS
jgi:hypothetical protein